MGWTVAGTKQHTQSSPKAGSSGPEMHPGAVGAQSAEGAGTKEGIEAKTAHCPHGVTGRGGASDVLGQENEGGGGSWLLTAEETERSGHWMEGRR